MIYLKNFTKLNNREKRVVFKWRNHPKVRTRMFDSKPIPYKKHKSFLNSLKKSTNLYFLVKKDETCIGVVTLKKDEIGLYSAPYKKGAGKILLEEIAKEAARRGLRKIYAQVFYNNKKALKLYEKYGFKKIGKKRVDKKRDFLGK